MFFSLIGDPLLNIECLYDLLGYNQNSYNNDTNTLTSAQNTYETIRSHQKDVKFPEASGLVPLPSDQPISKPVKTGKEAEVDALTNLLLQNMEASADPDFFGKF